MPDASPSNVVHTGVCVHAVQEHRRRIEAKAIASCSSSTYAIVVTIELVRGVNNVVGSQTTYCYNTNVCLVIIRKSCNATDNYHSFGSAYHQHVSNGTKMALQSGTSGTNFITCP